MDAALLLRKTYDEKRKLDNDEINRLLDESRIVQKLTRDYEERAFFHIFRILCLAEIPHVNRLPYTQRILSYISERLATSKGFTYTGKLTDLVPCYNAMLMEAYVRMGLADSAEVQGALKWIKDYQVFERGRKTRWEHDGICRHGGCMRAVPCYIGIGKTVRALITYWEFTKGRDREVAWLIDKGTDYMLKHNMYQRLSNGKPISAHITDIMFPQAYMLSMTDLVYIAEKWDLWEDEGTGALKDLLSQKAVGPGQWKIDYIYSHKGYKAFETKRNASQWIEHLFSSVDV